MREEIILHKPISYNQKMKLEYLNDVGGDEKFTEVLTEQLIRLYDFDKIQATELKQAIEQFLTTPKNPLDLSMLTFIECVNCNLVLRVFESDEGITTRDQKVFFCDLTIDGYKNILTLLEPFCNNNRKSYQWLYEIDNPIEFLCSPGGGW